MDMTDVPSEPLDRRYQLIKVVGNGQMSTVYQGEDLSWGRKAVAVKVLHTIENDLDLTKLVYERETKALNRLQHSNIIRIHHSGWSKELMRYYIVLEYVPRTLLGLIQAHASTPRDHAWCWPIMRALVDALVHAHGKGIIHRDIKPTNILITPDGTPKLTDFGISRLKFELSQGQTVSRFWTPGYASPEQQANQQAGEQSDIYSLGCVFFYMLSGQPPSPHGITASAIRDLPFPENVKRLLRQMVEQEPDRRFRKAHIIKRQLENIEATLLQTELFFHITDTARRNLYDLGCLNHSTLEEAQRFLISALGNTSPKKVHMQHQSNGDLHVLVDSLRLVCASEASSPVLSIKRIEDLYEASLAQQKNNALMVRYYWRVVLDKGAVPAGKRSDLISKLNELYVKLEAHARQQQADQAQQAERRDFMKAWRLALSLRKRQLDSMPVLSYQQFKKVGKTIIFELSNPAPDNLAWHESDPVAVFGGGDKPPPIRIGQLLYASGNEVQVAWEPADIHEGGSPRDLPRTGRIGIFQQEAKAAVDRQFSALERLKAGKTHNSRLPEVLLNPASAIFGPVNDHIEFYQANLADDKKLAVSQALAAEDIFLLQGPPGTGKTTTLAEIILQILKMTPADRILVSSQSNLAVDHILSSIAKQQDGHRYEIVRLGRAEKMGPGAGGWLLEHRLETWRAEVLARTDPVLEELREQVRQQQQQFAQRRELLPEEVEALTQGKTQLEELKFELDELRETQGHLEDLQAALKLGSGTYGSKTMEKQFQQQIRQKTTSITKALAHIRSMLPKEERGEAEPSLQREHTQLEQLVTALLSPSARAESREAQLLELVNEWRQVFGKDNDFAEPLLERATILAATCMMVGSRYLRDEEFDWAIIDEAGRATFPELLVPLVRARRSIIVGDERQLPPTVDQELKKELLADLGVERKSLEESLFATLVEQATTANSPVVQMLTKQHRMHPAIGELVSTVFYQGKLEHAVTPGDRDHRLDWIPTAVACYSTTREPDHVEKRRDTSFYNRAEVSAIDRLLHHMEESYQQQGEIRETAVITPYNAQIAELREQVRPDGPVWKSLKIQIATVDAFQGRDCDIVLYSTVRSNAERHLGFLKDWRRLNVALSRARQLLIIVGDMDMLENGRSGGKTNPSQGNPFQELMKYLREHPEDCLIQDITGGV